MPDVFFSCRGVKQGWADVSLRAGAGAPAYFWGVKLMFVGVMNFGQYQKIRLVVVKVLGSYSNQFLVILILSS